MGAGGRKIVGECRVQARPGRSPTPVTLVLELIHMEEGQGREQTQFIVLSS